jgi:endoglucanase
MVDRRSRRHWLQAGAALAVAPFAGSEALAAGKANAGPAMAAATPGKAAVPPTPPVWADWEAFKKQFVSDTGRVSASDPEGPRTYSEGQSYALFFALVANDRGLFETILQWTENNLCGGDLTVRLPAWLWGKRKDGDWGVIDSNPASDADVWIAYALGEAGRLWNDRRYRALSALLAARVLREETAELPGLGLSLLPAPSGFQEGPDSWRLNPSYMPLQVMHWLAASEPESPWARVADSSLQIVLRSAPKGFSPDWTVYSASQGFSVYAEGNKGQGTYNAIRVYTWAGMMHPQAAGARPLLTALGPMAQFVREKGYPPESIDILTGQASGPAPSGFSAALLPFLHSLGDRAALNTQRLRMEARPLRPDAYYEQVLGLFGKGWVDGWFRFGPSGHLLPRWAPQ